MFMLARDLLYFFKTYVACTSDIKFALKSRPVWFFSYPLFTEEFK